jgi:substrate import-associated zinc metallohydrolase lipoprotein
MKKIFYLLIFVLVLFAGCDEEDDLGPSIIDTSTPKLSELDTWIRENYTTPYNVEIKYKWDDTELENDKILVPPAGDKVKPFLEAMLKVWVKPYETQGGETFIRKYIPKLLVLVGSRNYNDDGTITQGQAESGKKIEIFELNHFDPTNKALIKRQFHVMHHEFGHILHQTIMFPVEYKSLTPEGYTATWYNFSDSEALEEGFITSYAKSAPEEDFVEMIATMLTNSKEEWDAIIDGVTSDDGRTMLRTKESYIINYFSQAWNIDVLSLQASIQDAVNALADAETGQ